MIRYKMLPKLIRWIVAVMCSFLTVMTIFRLLFFFWFNPSDKPFSGSAMLMGLRFDVKFVSIMAIVIFVLCAIPWLHPFKNYRSKYWWNIIIPFAFIFLVFFYAADYYHYDYQYNRHYYHTFHYYCYCYC